MVNKKAQHIMGMSFGTIFSILLIIVFVVFAFIVIRSFLNTSDCAKIGIFVDDFQSEVDKTWNSQKSNFEFKGRLPSGLDYVCFANFSNSLNGQYDDIGQELGDYYQEGTNLFLYPREESCEMAYHTINHLNMEKISESQNPYCIEIKNGNIDIMIEKDFNEALVSLS